MINKQRTHVKAALKNNGFINISYIFHILSNILYILYILYIPDAVAESLIRSQASYVEGREFKSQQGQTNKI